tara:strand:+ start:73 stop:783 length:711 start_codon:yes stop_codon:yes gene_type:complete
MLPKLNIIILAGGQGTRIKKVIGNTPKLLANLNGITFFDYCILWLKKNFNKTEHEIVIASGFGHEALTKYCETNSINCRIIRENIQLGTYGAVLNCLDKLKDGNYLILNGDTIFDCDLSKAYEYFLTDKKSPLLIVKKSSSNTRYGGYILKENYLSLNSSYCDYISMGAVFATKSTIIKSKPKSISPIKKLLMMDQDFINKSQSRCYVIDDESIFIDIGTPISYKDAKEIIPKFIN